MNRIYRIQLFVILGCIFFSTKILAGLSVEPVTLEVVAPKEEEQCGVFKIKNTGTDAIKIHISSEKWGGCDIDINNWLVVQPLEFELLPDEVKETEYKIVSPKNSSGELKCMVFFVADVVGEQKSAIGIRFGVPIYAVVSGTEKIDVKISEITITYDYAAKIIDGTVLVDNGSNIHIRPKIEVKIYNAKDKLVTNFSVPYGQPAQAEQIRPFVFHQPMVLGTGKYKLYIELDYGELYGLMGQIAIGRKSFVVKIPKNPV